MLADKVKRVFLWSFKNLFRNMWLSVATIIIIITALFTITTMIALNAIGDHALAFLQEKVDISVQFKEDADENKILELKKDLEKRKDVKSVEYISKEQALINFKNAHKDNEYINKSLEELGENPLFAVLNIKANELDDYKAIDEYLSNNENYKDIISKVNFKKNEKAIENFSRILKTVKEGIFGLILMFTFISVLVAFNTIRLAMYAYRREIEIMRLVGASNWYIRAPFIIEGVIFGIIGSLITLTLALPAAAYVSPRIEQFLPGFDFHNYFLNNLPTIAGMLLIAGIGIGVISSFIAIRRYLKV